MAETGRSDNLFLASTAGSSGLVSSILGGTVGEAICEGLETVVFL